MNVVAAGDKCAIPIVAKQGLHHRHGVGKRFNRFKQGHDVDAAFRLPFIERKQARFFQNQRQRQQIAGLFAVGNNALRDGVFAKGILDFARFVENRQLALRFFAVCDKRRVKRALVLQFAQQNCLFFVFRQPEIIFQIGSLKQLGNHVGVFFRVLTQIQRHQMKTAHRSGADDVGDAPVCQRLAAVVAQRILQRVQIAQKFRRISIRLAHAKTAAQRRAQFMRLAHHPRHHISHRAAIRLFLPRHFGIRRFGRQHQHPIAHIHTANRQRQFLIQRVQLAAIIMKRRIRMMAKRIAQSLR